MSEAKTSKVQAEVIIDLTLNQKAYLESMLKTWRTNGGIIIGGLAQRDEEIKVGFRVLPEKLGEQILKIVDDYYGGETNVNS